MSKEAAIFVVGIVLIAIGAGYYFGWFNEVKNWIPWFADKGDLKVMVYDAMQTSNTSDDVPLANVTVTILSTELVKRTDSNGTAMFSGVEVGDYQVQAEWNSATQIKNVTITKNAIATVTFLFNTTS
ncbi:MAG: carboxypeptidase-like regulatory domain-containing protein [Archaeoglobaceae archaeon]